MIGAGSDSDSVSHLPCNKLVLLLHLDIRKHSFTVRVMERGHRLPKEFVVSPPWRCSKTTGQPASAGVGPGGPSGPS